MKSLLLAKYDDCGRITILTSALLEAAHHGHPSAVRLLLENGACLYDYETDSVQLASIHGHLDVMKELILYGADVHAQDEIALIHACKHGHANIVQFLLNSGAHLHAQDNMALIEACRGGHDIIVRMLLNFGSNGPNSNISQALVSACEFGHESVVRMLFDVTKAPFSDWYININTQRDSPLIHACRHGSVSFVKMLVENGASISPGFIFNTTDAMFKLLVQYEQSTVRKELLLRAVCKNDIKSATILLEHDKKIICIATDLVDELVAQLNYPMVLLLVEHEIYLYMNQDEKDKLFLGCCEMGWLASCKKLLINGANLHINVDQGLRRAVENGHKEVVEYLLQLMRGYDMRGHAWALTRAYELNKFDIVKLFQHHDANLRTWEELAEL
jgi:ankyrin repeat protein